MKKSGYIAIVGQPNVGKSTLLNRFLGKKLSITSAKPQTTRHRILGIKTIDEVQMVFVDTPGLHVRESREINKYMNRAALAALNDVDVVLFVVRALHFDSQDEWVLEKIKQTQKPVVLAINQIDCVAQRELLLPFIDKLQKLHDFTKMIPISAKHGDQVAHLCDELIELLPEDHHYFSPEQLTDRSDRFVATEIIREKLMRFLGQELPYAVTATLDKFEKTEKIIRIAAVIWVEREGQKAIVIGHEGEKLKQISTQARLELERYFSQKVFLQVWVKVKNNWSDDQRALQDFGYDG